MANELPPAPEAPKPPSIAPWGLLVLAALPMVVSALLGRSRPAGTAVASPTVESRNVMVQRKGDASLQLGTDAEGHHATVTVSCGENLRVVDFQLFNGQGSVLAATDSPAPPASVALRTRLPQLPTGATFVLQSGWATERNVDKGTSRATFRLRPTPGGGPSHAWRITYGSPPTAVPVAPRIQTKQIPHETRR